MDPSASPAGSMKLVGGDLSLDFVNTDLEVVDAAVAESRRHEHLVLGDGGLRWEWRDAGRSLGAPLWPVARAAAALLAAGRPTRLHVCGGESCGWLFLDRSRNGSRQWCMMEDCGNVSKVRRFRRRHARRKARPPASP